MLDELHGPFVAQVIEKSTDVGIKHPVHSLPLNAHRQCVQRLMRAATGAESVRVALEVDLIYLVVKLQALVKIWVRQPTTQPWGTRSVYFRDPDGNLVNFYMPAKIQ
jgi:catechol 2,3-dioxygenase-like lactoylglutathione lyase family enzyme